MNTTATKSVENKEMSQTGYSPASEKLQELVYDQHLAEQAQRWANNCTNRHDGWEDREHPKWQYVGQNWAPNRSYEISFNDWFIEHLNYTYETMKCDRGEQCGHYIQIVATRTTHIGCGSAMCKKSIRTPWRTTVVCNYGPTGYLVDLESKQSFRNLDRYGTSEMTEDPFCVINYFNE
ncbi:unnamed protein product [Fasciola hepatica]|uniref:SCP domain-containing protein n=1 Tax=Fasciola hepatica TaxID=6192 RepID=A0ABC9HIM9_FASHE